MTRSHHTRSRSNRTGLLLLLPLLLPFACGTPPSPVPEGNDPAHAASGRSTTDSLRRLIIADSLSDGHHAYRNASGRITMEGIMRNGQRQGVWTSYFANSRVRSRTEYAEGVTHGITTVFHDNGVLYYTGSNRHGKPSGEWRFYDRQGILLKTAAYDTAGAVINTR